jgi:hypothetical protein
MCMILHFLCLDGKGDFLEFFLWRERFDLPKGSIQISAYGQGLTPIRPPDLAARPGPRLSHKKTTAR